MDGSAWTVIASKLGEDLAQPLDRAEHPFLRQPRPLATHDEMIDPEQFAVARDLFLYRDLVADDEAIAREILERAGRPVLQAPGRVGVVFVFERPPAFLVRR